MARLEAPRRLGLVGSGLPDGGRVGARRHIRCPLVTPKPASHVETTLSAIEAGSAPNRVYYLGRSFNGWDLEDAGIYPVGSETVLKRQVS